MYGTCIKLLNALKLAIHVFNAFYGTLFILVTIVTARQKWVNPLQATRLFQPNVDTDSKQPILVPGGSVEESEEDVTCLFGYILSLF